MRALVTRDAPSPAPSTAVRAPSCSVIVPVRNERGNVAPTLARIPQLGQGTEVIFVEGHSTDGTLAECRRVQAAFSERDVKVVVQPGCGKGDAVRAGMARAAGDVVVVLDGDLTVAPEELVRFYDAVIAGEAVMAAGDRFVLPMAKGAMPLANRFANRFYAALLSRILGRRIGDALCGVKALRREHVPHVLGMHARFGRIRDEFGDFDFLFAAVAADADLVTVPVRYFPRTYGRTQIAHVREGVRLLWLAWRGRRILRG